MIFDDTIYTYLPDELQHKDDDDEKKTEDKNESSSPSSSSGEHHWTWGPNGENSPEYNAWYWDTHKDEIMARRDELKKERGEGEYGIKEEAEDLRKALEERLEQNHVSPSTRDKARAALERYILDLGGANARRSSNGSTSRGSTKQKEDDEKVKEALNKALEDSDDNGKSSKKSSGGSGGSSGSSKKSSKKSGSGSGGKSSGGGSKGSKGSSGSKGTSGSSKEKSDSDKTAKTAAKKAEEESTDSTTLTGEDGKKYTYDKDTMNSIKDIFSKIESDTSDENSPHNNYLAFISALVKNGYKQVDTDEGLVLWKLYRSTKGFATSSEKVAEQKKLIEQDEEKKKLQHGMDTFEDTLEHHGILGMKWYVKNGPPYPLDYESHNSSEKKAGWEKSLSSAGRKAAASAKKAYETSKPVVKKAGKSAVQAAKNANEKSKAKKKAKQEAERERAKEEYQRNRENAIKSGNAQYARDHFTELSNDEINTLLGRLDLSKKVDAANNVKSAADKIDDFVDGISRAKNWTDKGSQAWNSFARLYNTMNGDDPLPIIGEDFNKTKRDIQKDQYERAQESLYQDILRHPEKATKSNLAKLNPNQVQSIKNVQENTSKIIDNSSWIDDYLSKSEKQRAKVDTSKLTYTQQKQLTEALKAENDFKKALAGEFSKGDISEEKFAEYMKRWQKANGGN